MSKPPVDAKQEFTEEEVGHLLELAQVSASNDRAMSWLRRALVDARSFNRTVKRRPLPADHNDVLKSVSSAAKKLTRELRRLRLEQYTYTCWAFWRSVEPPTTGIFDRGTISDAESNGPRRPARRARLEDREVLSILDSLERAAQTARDRRQGRPSEAGKQHLVDLALAFFVRFSARKLSGTPTGAFAHFARAFYATVERRPPDDDEHLDRQIRQAMKRDSVARERVKHLSTQLHNKKP